MKILKVNNFANYLIFRVFITLIICFYTYTITGRIADSFELLGREEFNTYTPGGSRTLAAKSIYSVFININSFFLIIFLITIITSILIYFLYVSILES